MKIKKEQKTFIKIFIMLVFIFSIIITSNISLASITPGQITGTIKDEKGKETQIKIDGLDFLDTVTNAIRTIGVFIAVGALMIIGIKYVMGSIEEKASYKKSMMPYIIGCFVLFGASIIAPQLPELFKGMGTSTEDIGNTILGFIQAIGSIVSVGVLMILGIKYMMGSTEERASYKRSMLPYVIGVVVIFGAVNITKSIYNFTISSTVKESEGRKAAREYISAREKEYNEPDAKKQDIVYTAWKEHQSKWSMWEAINAKKTKGKNYDEDKLTYYYEYSNELWNWISNKPEYDEEWENLGNNPPSKELEKIEIESVSLYKDLKEEEYKAANDYSAKRDVVYQVFRLCNTCYYYYEQCKKSDKTYNGKDKNYYYEYYRELWEWINRKNEFEDTWEW